MIHRSWFLVLPLLLLNPLLADDPAKGIDHPDPKGDYLFKRMSPEMDITNVTLTRQSNRRMRVTLTFAGDLPAKAASAPYRIWLRLELDDDETTGQQEPGLKGLDMAIAINGASFKEKWTSYEVPKSPAGKESDVKVEDIKVRPHELSFLITGKLLDQKAPAKLALTTCTEGAAVVDTFPDRGWLVIPAKLP
jgi:hypothetical protein